MQLEMVNSTGYCLKIRTLYLHGHLSMQVTLLNQKTAFSHFSMQVTLFNQKVTFAS